MTQSGVVTFTIKLDGKSLANTWQVLRLRVHRRVNRIACATVHIRDGSAAQETFAASESTDFAPGKTLTIAMGYVSTDEPVFSGIIVKQTIETHQDGGILALECKHPAVQMTTTRSNAYYLDSKDSDLIKKLLGKYQIKADVAATTVKHSQMVQYYATDWDFLCMRAEVNGQLVFTEDDAVRVAVPQVTASPALTLVYGRDILSFNAELDTDDQYPQVTARSWNADQQKIIEVKGKTPQLPQSGDASTSELANAVDNEPLVLQHGGEIDSAAMQAWADTYCQKSGLARIRGSVACQGAAKIQPGDILELQGLGKTFDGKLLVCGVEQTMTQGNWITRIAFGLSTAWFGERRDIAAPLSQGLLPGVRGLQIGVVTQIKKDPQESYRVQVKLPVIDAKAQGVWARMGHAYAGKEYGSFFLPEIDDEVVLGFLDNDPRNPVILGALQSRARPPAAEGKEDPAKKYIITKNQLKWVFDDQNKAIDIQTPGGYQLLLSEQNKSIIIKDAKGNQYSLQESGITLDSPGDIVLKAQGDITLEANNISAKASMNLDCEGMNVNHKAQTQFKAQGSATAEVSSTGMMTIKGATVMIN